MTLAHRVRHLFIGVDLAREPRTLRVVEPVARHLGEIDAHADDHVGGFGSQAAIPTVTKLHHRR